MRRVGNVACTGGIINCNILVGNPEGKRLVGRLRGRWGIILKWMLKIN
jgi:hypothetical protein